MNRNSTFEVIPLGVGNFFSTFRYSTTLLLCAGDEKVLIDCPDPIFRIFAEANKKSTREFGINDINHVVLTHLHGDHSNGLEGFGYYHKYILKSDQTVHLHTSDEVAQKVWQKLSVSMEDAELPAIDLKEHYELTDFYNLHSFEIGATIEVCGIQIETRRTLHTLPTFGFRATFGGRRFGYSCDTMFDPELIDFLAPCDLIFHECDLGIHTHLAQLEALPQTLREKIRLVHLWDDYPGSDRLQTAEEGQVYII